MKIFNSIKILKKLTLLSLILVVSLLQSACYKENMVIPDMLVSNGKVANIAIMWVGSVRTTATTQPPTTITVTSGASVPVNVEYISEVDVKEFKLYSRNGTTGNFTLLNTISLSSANAKYDKSLMNMVASFNVLAPSSSKATMQIAAEIVTSNGLVSSQKTVTIKTN